MRKAIAILLLSILSFNLLGYQFVFSFLENKAYQSLETSLDNYEYDESELVEVSVPLNMLYQERFTDFERHYGEIEIDGKSYAYVKRKISGNVVIFKCIPNKAKEILKEKKNDLAKANAADTKNNNEKKQTLTIKFFSGEYDDSNSFNLYCFNNRFLLKTQNGLSSLLEDGLWNTPFHPPKFCC